MKKVSPEQLVKSFRIENPWWKDGQLPEIYKNYKPRAYLDLFYPLLETRQVSRAIVLMGPRRVGKTVLIHHAIQNLLSQGTDPRKIAYFSVDHPLYNGLGLEDFLSFAATATGVDYLSEQCWVFFDEIQYLKNWEIHLKAVVDRFPNIKCTVSGSAAAALRLKSNESGAGRFTDFLLPPLTFCEYLDLLNKTDLISPAGDGLFTARDMNELNGEFIDYINFGGYPEMLFSEIVRSDPGRFIKSDIIDKVLLRDLPGLYGIQDIQELNYLFTTLAFNTSKEISLEQLARGSEVAKNTIKRYLEYLEAAFLIKIVHRVDRSAKRFKRANFFKVYLTNPSMYCALFGPVQANDQALGALCETAVFAQWFHSNMKLYYARWKNGEVDIVNLANDQEVAWAIEVKWSDRFVQRPGELRGLIQFCHANNLGAALVTTLTASNRITHENIALDFHPASLYCYTLGHNLIKGRRHGLHGWISGYKKPGT